jgi:phage baseplate assembly protein W
MAADVQGLQFPFRIGPGGGLSMIAGAEKIRQNVLLILGTRQGERPMLRNFGTKIASLVHDPNDDVLAQIIRDQAREALLVWEPRILITNAQLEQNQGELRLTLTYVVVPESRAERMVIPLA